MKILRASMPVHGQAMFNFQDSMDRLSTISYGSRTSSHSSDMFDLSFTAVSNGAVSEMTTLSVDQFLDLVRQGELTRAHDRLRGGSFEINCRDEVGRTCLHYAIEGGELQVAAELIRCGIDVNIKDEGPKRETALHIALRRKNLEATRLIMEAPNLDLNKCGSLLGAKKLPAVNLLENIHTSPASSTLNIPGAVDRNKGREQYVIHCRQSSLTLSQNSFTPNKVNLADVILLQTRPLPAPDQLMQKFEQKRLTNMIIAGCGLSSLPDDMFVNIHLKTLVLSDNNIASLPGSMFKMITLEVLKLDRNKLLRIPDEIGQLRNLKQFTCDEQKQRPGLKSLPRSVADLEHLETLSFSNNEVENIYWVPLLKNLRCLRCDRNRIDQLPKQFGEMKELQILDISHNRLTEIPCFMLDLIRQLSFFGFYNSGIKPKSILQDKQHLVSYLEVQAFLSHTSAMRTFRDINIAFVGESNAGKASLIDALQSENGLSHNNSHHHSPSAKRFDISHFELSSGRESFYVSAFNMSNSVLDPYLREVMMDLYVLTFDMTTLELHQASPHIFARHINRMQMWLQTLFELAPQRPVIIAGTRAESVKNAEQVWTFVQGLLEQGRDHHEEYFLECDHPYCMLCNRKGTAHRVVNIKSKNPSPGFVDLSFQENNTVSNGKVPTGDENVQGKLKMPHVIGYYEVECQKNFPKDNKKANLSRNQLRDALVKNARNIKWGGIPNSWISFIKQVHGMAAKLPQSPTVSIEELESIAGSLDIPRTHIDVMLHYFHTRGSLVYFPGDPLLSYTVGINPSWYVNVVEGMLTGLEASQYMAQDLVQIWNEEYPVPDAAPSKQEGSDITKWLGRTLMKLGVCVGMPVCLDRSSLMYLVPHNLEMGYPDPDVWPDIPEWDERQISVEFDFEQSSNGFFSDLIVSLIQAGAEDLQMIAEPAPLIHFQSVLFFTALDAESCTICSRTVNGHGQNGHASNGHSARESYEDDIMHKVLIKLLPHMESIRITVRGPRPCCVILRVVEFVRLHLDDAIIVPIGDTNSNSIDSPFGDRQLYILCPKCVLTRQTEPVRFPADIVTSRGKAICSKWHNLGSWSRVLCGDYKIEVSPGHAISNVPANEHPRLAMVLPPSVSTSRIDWCMRSRLKFLEGFEVHFLCEYPGGWHLPDVPGIRLNQSETFIKRAGNCLSAIINMALAVTQVISGVQEIPTNMPTVAPAVGDLIKMYDYLRLIDQHITDPATWLTKNKDRMINLLTKSIAGVYNGLPDLYFKAGTAQAAENVFKTNSTTTRHQLGKFLRIDSCSGNFGALRPLYCSNRMVWLCELHFDEMRRMTGR